MLIGQQRVCHRDILLTGRNSTLFTVPSALCPTQVILLTKYRRCELFPALDGYWQHNQIARDKRTRLLAK